MGLMARVPLALVFFFFFANAYVCTRRTLFYRETFSRCGYTIGGRPGQRATLEPYRRAPDRYGPRVGENPAAFLPLM